MKTQNKLTQAKGGIAPVFWQFISIILFSITLLTLESLLG
jgi:hypothetical protein